MNRSSVPYNLSTSLRWKDISGTTGLGFLRKIAFKLLPLFIQCADTDVLMVPLEGQGEKSWERDRESRSGENGQQNGEDVNT